MTFRSVSLESLIIEDDDAFMTLPVYAALKRALAGSGTSFLIPEAEGEISWDRALFLNLTFWSPDAGVEVLCNDHIPADVVAHAAWHHVVSQQLGPAPAGEGPAAEALFFAEAIASAFDLYLVGRLLREASGTDFISTQVPIMRDVAADAGLSEDEFASLLEGVCADPAQAFEELRALLFQVTTALWACRGVAEAANVLGQHTQHRFGPLLHHFQLSNWILYARAYAGAAPAQARAVNELDGRLRDGAGGLSWLQQSWLSVEPSAG